MVISLLRDQAIAAKSPFASISTGPIKDDAFTQSAAPSPDNQMDPNIPEASLGKFTKVTDEPNFVGNEHWEAILEDIVELKIDLEPPATSEMGDFKPQILFSQSHASRSEIMASIPPRPICDMLISRWFRTMDMAPSKFTVHLACIRSNKIITVVVHAPTFMKEVSRPQI